MARALFHSVRVSILALCVIVCTAYAHADTATSSKASDIQSQIDAHNAAISQIDQEIAQYQKQLDATTAKKQTLQTTITQLNTSIKKTSASIKKTQTQIATTQLQITQLGQSIAEKQAAVTAEQLGLSQSIRRLNETERMPLIVSILSEDSITSAWEDIDFSEQLQHAFNNNITTLAAAQKSLADTKDAATQKRQQYVSQIGRAHV